jgi:hypothetical protein
LRFFPISKIEYQLNLHFLATGRFCRPSLSSPCQSHSLTAQERDSAKKPFSVAYGAKNGVAQILFHANLCFDCQN